MKVVNEWININDVQSIPNSRRIKIQNIGNTELLVQCSEIIPTDDDLSVVLDPKETLVVRPDQYDVWVKAPSHSSGWIYAQSNSPYDFSDNGLDPRLYTGLQGIITQPFTEANVKNGTQFEVSFYTPALAAGANLDIVFTTGDLPILLKASHLEVNGAGITMTFYRSPTYTGGTPVQTYNLNSGSGIEAQTVVLQGATVTSAGVQISTPITFMGSVVPGASSSSVTNGEVGLDRVFEPNTTYLRRITSIDTNAQVAAFYTTWYEGPLSVDLL